MPLPSARDVHQDSVLTNLSVRYRNAEYIAPQCVPKAVVRKASDRYYVFDQGDWFRDEAGERVAATTGPVGGYRLSTQNYDTKQFSMATYVADEERDNADAGLDLDRQAIEYCADKVLMRFETQAAKLLFSAANYPAGHKKTLSGNNQWSGASSTPIADLRAAKAQIGGKIGRQPNTLILGEETYLQLQDHADILDRVKYTQSGAVTPDLLSGLFDVKRTLVGRAVENAASEGLDPNYQRVWGKHAALIYVPDRPGMRTISFAYWFVWRGYDFIAERWRKADGGASDGFRVRAQWDAKIVAKSAGYFIENAVA